MARNVHVSHKADSKYEVVFASGEVGQLRVHVHVNKKAVAQTPLMVEVKVLTLRIVGDSVVLCEEWQREILFKMLPASRRTLTKLLDSNKSGHCGFHSCVCSFTKVFCPSPFIR